MAVTTTAESNPLHRRVMAVAAILIALGLLVRLYQLRSPRGDARAFGRLEREIARLDVPDPGKHVLHEAVSFSRQLVEDARQAADATTTT
jgi:hypothetical protein